MDNVVPINRHRNEDDLPRKKEKRTPPQDINLEEAFTDLGIHSFDKEYKKLRRLSTAEDFSSPKASYALLRAQLAMVISAMPILEKNLHHWKNDKAAYALVSLSSHARELSHDLRSFGDQTEVVERVRRNVMQPTLSALATAIVSNMLKTKQDLHNELPPKTAKMVSAALKRMQNDLQALFADADVQAAELLARSLKG